MKMSQVSQSGSIISLPGRYAKVLFDLAHEQKLTPRIGEELDLIVQTIDKHAALATALYNPTLTRKERIAILSTIGQKLNISDLLLSFLATLCHNRRYKLLKEIIKIYHHLNDEHYNRQHITIEYAHPLTKTQLKEITSKLEQMFGKNLIFNYYQNPLLLGGVKILHGNHVIDLSFATQLSNLASFMKGAA